MEGKILGCWAGKVVGDIIDGMSEPLKLSLAEKLKSLRVKQGTADIPIAGPESQFAIDKVVSGTYRPGLMGETFVAQQTFGTEYRHGQAAIRPEAPLDVLAAWAREPRFLELPMESYAFLDTETSGLAGGTGTYAFLVGVGRFVGSVFWLEQFFMRDPAEEACWKHWPNSWLPRRRWLLSMARHLMRPCSVPVIPCIIFRCLSRIMLIWICCHWPGACGVTGCPAAH